MLKECCQNCRLCLKLTQFDYKPTGTVDHVPMRGYICLAFASEGDAIWITGLNPSDTDVCEVYSPKDV